MNLATRKLTRILIAAVLCFSALRGYGQDAKLQLGNLDKLTDKAARVNLLNWDGKSSPPGLFPAKPSDGGTTGGDGEQKP